MINCCHTSNMNFFFFPIHYQTIMVACSARRRKLVSVCSRLYSMCFSWSSIGVCLRTLNTWSTQSMNLEVTHPNSVHIRNLVKAISGARWQGQLLFIVVRPMRVHWLNSSNQRRRKHHPPRQTLLNYHQDKLPYSNPFGFPLLPCPLSSRVRLTSIWWQRLCYVLSVLFSVS